MSPSIHIGTSGWHYDHWRGPFYPRELKDAQMLSYYVDRFSTVEINNSFYRLPSTKTLHDWHEAAPSGFVFAFKASRYITHMKKLKTEGDAVGKLMKRAADLSGKLGPILFQLPPRWKVNPDRLSRFLRVLPDDSRYAFEFRDSSWHDPRVYELLAARNAAFCIYDIAGVQSVKRVTADFVYIRLHGPQAEPYKGRYPDQTLAGWAGAFHSWQRQGKEIFCYFDNDEKGYAVVDAMRLEEMLSG